MKHLIVLLALLLAACATAQKMNRLSTGMTKPEVIAVMGEPDSTNASEGAETLMYLLSANNQDAMNGFKDYYFVQLTEGRVSSYGKAPSARSADVHVVVPVR